MSEIAESALNASTISNDILEFLIFFIIGFFMITFILKTLNKKL